MSMQRYLSHDISELDCTKKSCDEIHCSSSSLSQRERQLLILMTASNHLLNESPTEKSLYCNAILKLIDKIDLGSLIERGYLVRVNEEESTPLVNQLPSIDVADIPEPDEYLRLAAGNFEHI